MSIQAIRSADAARVDADDRLGRLEGILQSISDMVLTFDHELRYTFANDAMVRAVGRPREQIVGKTLTELFPDVAGTLLERELRRALEQQTPTDFEFFHASHGRWFHNRAHPNAEGLTLVATEITERKAAEARQTLLTRAGQILGSSLDYEITLAQVTRLVVPMLADWCSIDLVDGEGKLQRLAIVHADPNRLELAQELRRRYPPSPEDRHGIMRVIRSGEPELHAEITDELLRAGAREPAYYQAIRDLNLRSIIIVPLVARGRTLGALTLASAESGRRYGEHELSLATELANRAALAVDNARLFAEAQEALRLREEALELHRSVEEKLTLLVEASGSITRSLEPHAVLEAILALSGRLVAADAYAIWRNRPDNGTWAIEVASGLSERYVRALIPAGQGTRAVPETLLIAEDVAATDLLGERKRAHLDEGVRSMLVVPLRIHDGISGTLVFYYRAHHRFTEVEKRVAMALGNLAATAIGMAELYAELREKDRRKDEFLAMLAHELRNPLVPVMNAVEILKLQGPSDRSLQEQREMISRQVRLMKRLLDDLLDVSRITRGTVLLKREHTDLASVLTHAIEASLPLVESKGHEFTLSLPPGPFRLEADPARLAQVVTNLLHNAAKYTDPGGRIELAVQRDGDHALIAVRDSGVGMTEEMLERAFDLFTQADTSLDRSQGGLGIGLTLVRRLVEMHGGTVTARSDGPGRGSEFVVRLPLVPASVASASPAAAPSHDGQAAGPPARVLVVDDSIDSAESLAKLLRIWGHEVRTAHDGVSALKAAHEFQPNVVFLDIGLPGMNGYEVARRLRQSPGLESTLIVAMTGYGQDDDIRQASAAGIDQHFVKPVGLDEVKAILASRQPAA